MSDTAKKCSTLQSLEVIEANRLARDLKRAERAESLRVARDAKAAQELADWETRTSARNPQFVVGSKRDATPDEATTLRHCHGKVCEIVCESCGETRTVNCQDAFQVKLCCSCKAVADREAGKAKRANKKAEGKSVAELEQEIERMKNLLAVKQAA